MSLYSELKRRNVIRVAVAYLVAAWLLLQVADVLMGVLDLPEFIGRAVFLLLVIGFLPVLLFAWAFELTPEGLRPDRGEGAAPPASPGPARKLDVAVIAMLVAVAALVVFDRLSPGSPADPAATASDGPTVESGPADDDAGATAPVAADARAAGAQAGPSIAVLPFVNMSPDPDNEYFADGVAEEILNVLVGVADLKVAARTSSFAFKGSELGIGEIAERLGVSHVLEGSVRKAGDQVRVTAQLIQAGDGFHLWSDTYDRQLTNIFAIQDEIAQNIARVLEVQLGGREKPYTRVVDLPPELYEKFLRARFLVRRRNEPDGEEAIRLLRDVTAAEPQFPDGLALLAEALSYREEFFRDRGEEPDPADRREISELLSRTLALEPDHALAYLLDSWLVNRPEHPLEIIRRMQRAIELDPSEQRPHHWLSIRYTLAGYLERAREEAATAVDLDPDQANARSNLGRVHQMLGNFGEAEVNFRAQLRLGNPDGAARVVHTAVLAGDLERARDLAKELPWPDPDDEDRIARFLAAVADAAEIPGFIAHLRANPVQARRAYPELMILGEYEAAYEFYDGNFWLAWSVHFGDARSLPQFETYVRESRLPEVWDVLGTPPACRKTAEGYDCSPGE